MVSGLHFSATSTMPQLPPAEQGQRRSLSEHPLQRWHLGSPCLQPGQCPNRNLPKIAALVLKASIPAMMGSGLPSSSTWPVPQLSHELEALDSLVTRIVVSFWRWLPLVLYTSTKAEPFTADSQMVCCTLPCRRYTATLCPPGACLPTCTNGGRMP